MWEDFERERTIDSDRSISSSNISYLSLPRSQGCSISITLSEPVVDYSIARSRTQRFRATIRISFCERDSIRSLGSSLQPRDTTERFDSANSDDARGWRRNLVTLSRPVIGLYLYINDRSILNRSRQRPSPRLLLENFVFEYDGQPECQPRLRERTSDQGRVSRKYISIVENYTPEKLNEIDGLIYKSNHST